jgi:asparagine synthase (glutamine-hydrolysing)
MAAVLDPWSDADSPVIEGDPEGFGKLDLEVGVRGGSALRMMHADALSYLPDDVLAKVDRASMAVGLETHAPFLDHRVATLAARLPMRLKVLRGQGKPILRRLLGREAPAHLFERPKAGFSVPVGAWLRGPLRDWAEDLLDPKALEEGGMLDSGRIAEQWRLHRAGREEASAALWPVLMFEAWRRSRS